MPGTPSAAHSLALGESWTIKALIRPDLHVLCVIEAVCSYSHTAQLQIFLVLQIRSHSYTEGHTQACREWWRPALALPIWLRSPHSSHYTLLVRIVLIRVYIWDLLNKMLKSNRYVSRQWQWQWQCTVPIFYPFPSETALDNIAL